MLRRSCRVVSQKFERTTSRNSSVECLVHGVIFIAVNLSKVSLRHTEDALAVIGNGRTLNHILGRVTRERTCGDLDGCHILAGSGRLTIDFCTERTVDRAAGDRDLRQLTFCAIIADGFNIAVDGAAADGQCAVEAAAVCPGRNCAVDYRILLDIGIEPVLDRVAILGADRTAFQVERAEINLDNNEVILRERTARDGQHRMCFFIAVVTDAHQRSTLACGVAAVVPDVAAVEGEECIFTLNVDDIVGGNAGVLCGVLTHDRAGLRLAAVHDRDSCGNNRQRRLALFGTAVQRMSVQIKRQRLINSHILARIRKQRDGAALRSSRDGFCECLILSITNLCYILACRHAVCAVDVFLKLKTISEVIRRYFGSKCTAGDIELFRRSNAYCAVDIKCTADVATDRYDNNLLRVRRTFYCFLEKSFCAFSCRNIVQSNICSLGCYDSSLFCQTVECGIFNLNSRSNSTCALIVGLNTANACKCAILNFRIAAVVPEIVHTCCCVAECATINYRIAILVVAQAIRECAVRICNGVLCRICVTEPCCKIICAVSVVTAVCGIRL